MESKIIQLTPKKINPIDLIRQATMGPKKSLGQHWLVSSSIVDKICNAVPEQSIILEIGPGLGILTAQLLSRAKQLFLIEKDTQLSNHLQNMFKNESKITLFNQDVLKFDFSQLPKANYWIVSNLPYNISIAIMNRFLKEFPHPKKMLLMFQKEVASRIISNFKQKSYGSLSIYCQSLCKITKHCEVKPGAFLPPPKVDSTVLYFEDLPERSLTIKQIESLEKIMGLAFLQRRKILKQSLKNYPDYQKLLFILDEMEWTKKRPEELCLVEWHQLIKALDKA